MRLDKIQYTKDLLNNTAGITTKQIQGNLFVIYDGNRFELVSIWYRGEKCTIYGLNNTYLDTTQNTIIIKSEGDEDKIYMIPNTLIQSLDLLQDEVTNRTILNLYNDRILLQNKKKRNIREYRIA